MQRFVLLLLLIIIIVALYKRKTYGGGGQSNSEAIAVSELERLTGIKFPTVNPPWLKWHNPFTRRTTTLELDGYNKDLGVAIEFSGPLHTKWFPNTESYKSYLTRVLKDKAKKETCAANGVCLIVLDMSLPRRHYRDYFASRLADCGKGERPNNYIAEQIATPYRNEHLEKNMVGLLQQ